MEKSQKPRKQPKFSRPATAFKHKQVFDKLSENGGNLAKAIRDTGLYSEGIALTPTKITDSKTWNELMEVYMSDDDLGKKHKELLNSTRMDHMVFPLGPKDEDDINFSGAKVVKEDEDKPEASMPEEHKERTSLTDKEIIEMLAEVNCKVRRIVHGETARHVYFWAADNMARDKALDKAYKLKGRYGDENEVKVKTINTYNFIFSKEVQEDVKAIEDRIKARLIKPNAKENQEPLGSESIENPSLS